MIHLFPGGVSERRVRWQGPPSTVPGVRVASFHSWLSPAGISRPRHVPPSTPGNPLAASQPRHVPPSTPGNPLAGLQPWHVPPSSPGNPLAGPQPRHVPPSSAGKPLAAPQPRHVPPSRAGNPLAGSQPRHVPPATPGMCRPPAPACAGLQSRQPSRRPPPPACAALHPRQTSRRPSTLLPGRILSKTSLPTLRISTPATTQIKPSLPWLPPCCVLVWPRPPTTPTARAASTHAARGHPPPQTNPYPGRGRSASRFFLPSQRRRPT